ncbi:MAG: amino acid adenylation domain-containing protein, partial [Bdellovibrionales bacterium]|nr:amino acid adenylation domain-containing protein [Bdellovibrionales bacterium]
MSPTSSAQTASPSLPTHFLDLFETIARRHPDRPALVFDGRWMSYHELATKTARLAHYLHGRGVVAGEVVAVSLPRGFDVILSMLAVLRNGGVYLPIDPLYPKERREFMVADAKPRCLITERELYHHMLDTSVYQLQVVTLDRTEAEGADWFANRSVEELPQLDAEDRSPENACYIIYTSGSTGQPKGALNTEQGLLNLAREQIRAFDITPAGRILQFAPFSFDASISEVVMALGAGAALVMAEQASMVPGPSLVQLLLDQRITHVTLPPSVLGVLPEIPFPDLEAIIVAGEPCPIELAERWSKGRSFFNAYGVSEAAVCSTIHRYVPGSFALPIGKAMGGIELHVVDDNEEQVAAGEVGELLIGGLGVGRGYLNRPELTAQKFVERSGPHGAASRFYRSGDRVLLHDSGILDYKGRADSQVKIRGFRIELDEVSHWIESAPEVEHAAAVVHTDPLGAKQLVGYYTAAPHLSEAERQASTARVREFLTAKLPQHMIPTHLLPVDAFPLSPSGKVDRQLLALRPLPAIPTGEIREARTAVERRLASICCELLHVAVVSFDSSFTDIGGDSLKAAELAWRVQENLSVRLSEADILGAATLAEVAARIESAQHHDSRHRPPLRQTVSRSTPIPVHPTQEIFCFLEKLGADVSPLHCCAAYEIKGPLDRELLQEAYTGVFRRHESLRLSYDLSGVPPKLLAQPASDEQLEFLDFSSETDQQLSAFFRAAERTQFDLRAGSPIRSWFITLAPDRTLLVIVAHHIAFDAWSLHILLQDLFALLAEKQCGRSFLPSLELQYSDYVSWFHQNETLNDQSSYRAYHSLLFRKPIPEFDLKPIAKRPEHKSRQGENIFIRFTQDDRIRLARFCEPRGLTPHMVWTALLKATLFFHSDDADIILGGPVATRQHRELERQIGLYASSAILRTQFSEQEGLEFYLQRMKSNILNASRYPVHSIIRLLEEFEIPVVMDRTPPFDVSFASRILAIPLCDPEVARLLSLEIRPYHFPMSTSFFDLEFTIHEWMGEVELETR